MEPYDLREFGRILHQIKGKEADGDKCRENSDRERPIGMPFRMTPEGQQHADVLEPALSHAVSVPSRAR